MAEAFIATHGTEVADIIMEHLPPEGWRELATKTDVSTQGLLLRNEFDVKISELRREVSDLRSEVTTGMSKLRSELMTGIAESTARLLKWSVGTVISMSLVMVGGMTLVATIIK